MSEKCEGCGRFANDVRPVAPPVSVSSEATPDYRCGRCHPYANDRSVRRVTGGSSVESPAPTSGNTPSPTSEETKK